MKQLKLWVLVVGMSVLSACGSQMEETQQVAEQQQAATSLQTVKAEASTAPALHYLDGHVEAVNQSTISAQTSGVIEKLFYDVDDFVEQGSTIARIKSKTQEAGMQQARASLDEAQARYKEAQTDFQRISEIYARKLVPKADYDAAEAGLKAAEARLAAAKAQVTQAGEQLGYTTLVAPYGGIVTKRHVELGETVNPGTPIMTGISLNEMRVIVEVPQRLITQVRKEKKAFVFQDGSYKSLPVRTLTFFPYADPKTNAFKVRIDLAEGTKDLFPGMFVKVAFVMGQQEGVVSVPESAVVVRSEVIGVYVINADGLPSLRQIRLGRKLDENNISVLAGLDAGETIALDPVQAAIFLKQQTAGVKHDE
ncbi:MAG: efflux RND transporter periplasmic adaptor subunit [Gammaproteobacteria bacterium]|nr:efflux RND transporter periplasmic adaptor subunit [Gammaproteobacteria bacterium]MBU1723321.1 efflux RND transporter periplasmic adaptor subunit [Gammaproteobacteria bacterium]MBU2006616.1 efflux RND transporter periplasmic adaptor subunit [Gammaproteobacteria bacterium]